MTDPTPDPARDLHPAPDHERGNATDPARRGEVPAPSVGRANVRHRRAVGWRSRDIVRTAGLVLAMYLGVKLLWFANALFLTLFLGILFAIAVSAGVDRLQRLRIPRGVGAALIVLTFFALLGGFGAWVAPTLRSQGAELRQKLPLAVDRVEEWFGKRQSGIFGILLGGGAPAPGVAKTTAASPLPNTAAAPPGQSAPRPVASTDSAGRASAVSTLRTRLQGSMGGASRYLFPFVTHTIAAVGGVLLIIFLSIYFAADPDLYRRGALALLPSRRRAQGAMVMDRIATVLRKWLVTQLIAMACIGAVSTIALLVLHVKAAFALGLLAGFFEFIPTVGPILSAVPAIAMGFLDSPEKALVVALVYIGIQFLENHILIPLLMKGGMDLPPAMTVLAQALLALVFGFLGLMVAVPLLATIMVVVQVLYVDHAPTPRAERGDGGGHPFDPELDEALGPVAKT
ncbi:MAG: AI-2E family transporter [Gemmatimonadaceae bacterium]|nr:AI-2E family transporter [Gemmatimonadaceae bacterium]